MVCGTGSRARFSGPVRAILIGLAASALWVAVSRPAFLSDGRDALGRVLKTAAKAMAVVASTTSCTPALRKEPPVKASARSRAGKD